MKKLQLILFITFICTGRFSFGQSLPLPDHIVVVMEENKAYNEIMQDSAAFAPYINSFKTDTNAAIFTQSYALTHPSQPNYLLLFSGDDQGVTTDDIASAPFTTCNLGASLLANHYTFIGYSEEEPSAGCLDDTYNEFARKHCPWTNWQGASANAIPSTSNLPYTSFPTDYSTLPDVSFIIPDLDDDMHDGSIPDGDTWLKNNLSAYIAWAKSNNSLLIVTFDEDDNDDNNNITTIFIGPMVKGGSYSNTITHYNVLRTIEDIYNLPACGSSSTADAITAVWRSSTTTGVNQLSFNSTQLSIYPDPVVDELNINYNVPVQSTLEIFDMLGRKVFEQTLYPDSKSPVINTSLFTGGMYELRVTAQTKVLTTKFIKE